MPKGIPKVNEVAEAIKLLVEAIAKLEVKLDNALEVKHEPVAKTEPEPIPEPVKEETPVPLEWRQVVDEVLGKAFGLSVRYIDGAQFELTISVPRQYSNASTREWDMNKADRRIKIMHNYLGAQGIKDYAELVAKNLGTEIMSKVQSDKQVHVNA